MTGPMVSASCPHCGGRELELSSDKVRLVVCEHPKEWSYYSFVCPKCSREVVKPAGAEVRNLLKVGGVVAESWVVPAEALEKHSGPAITYDDVLDFALLMALETSLTALVAQALIVPKPYDPRKPL